MLMFGLQNHNLKITISKKTSNFGIEKHEITSFGPNKQDLLGRGLPNYETGRKLFVENNSQK